MRPVWARYGSAGNTGIFRSFNPSWHAETGNVSVGNGACGDGGSRHALHGRGWHRVGGWQRLAPGRSGETFSVAVLIELLHVAAVEPHRGRGRIIGVDRSEV